MTSHDDLCAVRYADLDYTWRPSSYWDAPGDALGLILHNVKGTERRRVIREYWQAGRFHELEDIFLQDELTEAQRATLSRVHPACMGGEYLPPARRGEVTIARIELRSVTSDVIEVRAKPAAERIRYRIVDEYESSYSCSPRTSREPLTLGQLIDLIDDAGLTLGFSQANNFPAVPIGALRAFTQIRSDVYAHLTTHGDRVHAAWFEMICRNRRPASPRRTSGCRS